MEPIFFLAVAVALVIAFMARKNAEIARQLAEELRDRVKTLEREINLLKGSPGQPAKPSPTPDLHTTAAAIPPVSPATAPSPFPALHPEPAVAQRTPPPLPKKHPATPAQPVVRKNIPGSETPTPHIDWEELMGAKLFAWIGGLALFLGIAFFVKYSFDRNLIPPALRVAIGFGTGLILIAGGVLMRRKEYAVTAQTLCATGVVVLYAVTFACRSYYHFAFFGLVQTFGLMSLITALAFALAVRMNALIVGILGVAGGFLTPALLSTGQDNAVALFGYIALLDVGLLAISQRQRWTILPALGAIGTILTQASWFAAFFVPERYFAGSKIFIAMAILACFQALFLAAAWWAKRSKDSDHSSTGAALVLGLTALLGAYFFLTFTTLGHRPILICGYLFLVDLGLVALTLVAPKLAAIRPASGTAAFLFLAVWTEAYLSNSVLNAALGCFFVFALLHSALPLILQRYQKVSAPWSCHVFPVLSLLLVLIPIEQLHDLSFIVWPFVLFIDVIAFAVAVMTATLAPVLLVLLLTVLAIGASIAQIPSDLTGLTTDLVLLGACAGFFLAAGSWAARRLTPADPKSPRIFGSMADPANLAVQIPALSATLPFLLLIMVIVRLPLHDPSPVFALALLMVMLLLGLARFYLLDILPPVGLACVLALQHAWLASPYQSERQHVTLAWNLAFYAVFTAFPFVFDKQFAGKKAPWIASALAGPLHFYLVYEAVQVVFPRIQPGLLPAIAAIPSALALAFVARKHTPANTARMTQLALYGGAALFFVTLIFPLQFDRQWITISWALEGAALCWLFHRVPHPGLRLVGVALLAAAFTRLALNPAILAYHARAAYPIFNWYLYAFVVVTISLFAAARLLAPPRNLTLGVNIPPFLWTMGTVLGFLLVNVEIADYFTTPGAQVLTFDFSGNFARDMSYSIAWALFSLLLLVIGIWIRNAPVRYSSLALLGLTVLKLFLHDLSELDQLYRIGAFIAVAVIAILASFLYQRFLAIPAAEPDTGGSP